MHKLGKKALVVSFTTSDKWRAKSDLLPLEIGAYQLVYLFCGMAFEWLMGEWRIGGRDARIEKTQEIVNLCNCANCRTTVAPCGALFYSNHGG